MVRDPIRDNVLFRSGWDDELWKMIFPLWDELMVVFEKLPQTSAAPPSDLFHYTSPQATHAIVSSGVLRASDIAFLNDTREYSVGLEVFESGFNELERLTSDADDRDVVSRLKVILADSRTKTYVVCFSALRDKLSQWRGYARGGYALGFSTARLRNIAAQNDFWLRPVIYDEDAQRLAFIDFIEMAHEAYPLKGKPIAHDPKLHQAFSVAFGLVAHSLLPLFKDETFSEEQEWRLVSIPNVVRVNTKGTFVSGRYMVPFENVPFTTSRLLVEDDPLSAAMDESALSELLIGPPSGDGNLASGLSTLLVHSGYPPGDLITPRIAKSVLSFRG